MIRMYGDIVQVCKYRIDWTDKQQNSCSDYALTQNDANAIAQKYSGTVTAIDTSSENWLDGMSFQSRDEALSWLAKGEKAYNEYVQAIKAQNNEQLRADIDFLSVMAGVTL